MNPLQRGLPVPAQVLKKTLQQQQQHRQQLKMQLLLHQKHQLIRLTQT